MPSSPDPLTNPYAPPAAEPAPRVKSRRGSRSYKSERRSIALMVLLSVVTLFAYPVFWYLRRAPFFDSRPVATKVGGLQWAFLGVYVLYLVASLVHLPHDIARSLQLAVGVANLVLAFRVAAILRSDFARTGRPIRVSGVGVLFLGCLYLQHVMNVAADTPATVKRKKNDPSPESPAPPAA